MNVGSVRSRKLKAIEASMNVGYALNIMLVPTGQITIPEAVTDLLQRTHGKNWGQQEIGYEADEIPVLGAFTDDGKPELGQPLDREVVKEGRDQIRKARDKLGTALANGELTALIEDGPLIRPSYWGQSQAETTLITGILELGNFPDPEISKWRHRRVLLKQKQFDTWLNKFTGIGVETRGRRQNVDKDRIVKLKIEAVLATAKRLWPEKQRPPGRNQAARRLAEEKPVKDTGYSVETLRKILSGTYPASLRLGIRGFPGIDTRAN